MVDRAVLATCTYCYRFQWQWNFKHSTGMLGIPDGQVFSAGRLMAKAAGIDDVEVVWRRFDTVLIMGRKP
jgi:hypothetical protein